MVIPDWTPRSRPPKINFVPTAPSAANSPLARPIDRFAAGVVDLFVVLASVYLLLSAPLKRTVTMSLLTGAESEFISAIASMIALAIGLIVLYQTFLHYFFRATLGKMLFDLQIVPMFEGERLSCWDFFVRAWMFVLEVLCLGLPFLAVFSNNKRRPLHDRVCDTLVVSRTQSGVVGPLPLERALVRGLFGFFIIAVLAGILSQVRGSLDRLKSEANLSSFVEREAGACDVVTENFPEDQDIQRDHARLEMAMTLYAAGLADRSCLEAEVERELANQVPVGPVTYLAQAFVYADEADVSNSYLDEVCESAPGTVECAMSQVVSKWSEEDWEGVEEALTKAPRGSGYLEVWGVRHFMKQARYSKALQLLNGMTTHPQLAEFSSVQRVKAYFNSYREPEAEAALLQAMPTLPDGERRELAAWVCAQQLQSGCAALETAACQQLHVPEGKPIAEIDFQQPNEALARVLSLECKGEGQLDYLSFAESVHDEDWQTFFRANLKRQRDDKSAAGDLYSQLVLSSEAPDLLKIEAARRWAQLADRRAIGDVFEQWRDLPSKEVWIKTGNLLFKRLAELESHELALKVARYLLNSESLSPQALAVLSDMADHSTQAERRPANVKVKEQVKQLLDKFGED